MMIRFQLLLQLLHRDALGRLIWLIEEGRLVVVPGPCAGLEFWLAELHIQFVILVRKIRSRRIEGDGVEGVCICREFFDLPGKTVARVHNATAALKCKHLQSHVGGIRFPGGLHAWQIVQIKKVLSLHLRGPGIQAEELDVSLAHTGRKLGNPVEGLLKRYRLITLNRPASAQPK